MKKSSWLSIFKIHLMAIFLSGSSPGILYGPPKIHKFDLAPKFQFRRIRFTHIFNSCWSPLTTNEFTVDKSHHFSSDITAEPNADRYYIWPLSTKKMYFTNTYTPLETINICSNHFLTYPNSILFGLSKPFYKILLEYSVWV